jgi:hypothetical protein
MRGEKMMNQRKRFRVVVAVEVVHVSANAVAAQAPAAA